MNRALPRQSISSWHGIAVKLGDLVYPTEVITEAEGAVRLRDHDDRAGPRAARWFNYP